MTKSIEIKISVVSTDWNEIPDTHDEVIKQDKEQAIFRATMFMLKHLKKELSEKDAHSLVFGVLKGEE